jgi:hypothetical protein
MAQGEGPSPWKKSITKGRELVECLKVKALSSSPNTTHTHTHTHKRCTQEHEWKPRSQRSRIAQFLSFYLSDLNPFFFNLPCNITVEFLKTHVSFESWCPISFCSQNVREKVEREEEEGIWSLLVAFYLFVSASITLASLALALLVPNAESSIQFSSICAVLA